MVAVVVAVECVAAAEEWEEEEDVAVAADVVGRLFQRREMGETNIVPRRNGRIPRRATPKGQIFFSPARRVDHQRREIALLDTKIWIWMRSDERWIHEVGKHGFAYLACWLRTLAGGKENVTTVGALGRERNLNL